MTCGRDRGKDGTVVLCRLCADGRIEHTLQLKEAGLCILCGRQERIDGVHCAECRIRKSKSNILSHAKHRAKKKGIPFDITWDDINWVDVCPILGIPLVFNRGQIKENSYSLDRLIPEKGYVPGNVHIISYKANTIKQNASSEEIRKVADWLEQLLNEDKK